MAEKPSLDEIFATRSTLDEIFAPPKPPSTWDKVKKGAKAVLQEAGDAAEGLRATAGMIATLPIDIGNYGGALVDSLVQEDFSKENIDRNVDRRNQSVQKLKSFLNPEPVSERGKAIQQTAGNALAAPGILTNKAVTAVGNEVINTEDYPNIVPNLAGAASVLADIVVPLDIVAGVKAARPKPIIERPLGIGENTTPSNFQLREEGSLVTPPKPSRYNQEPVLNDMPQQPLMLPEPTRITKRRGDVEAAIAADNASLANEIAAGRNRPERVAENYGLRQEYSQEPQLNDRPTQYVVEPRLNDYPKPQLPPTNRELARQAAEPLTALYDTAVQIKNEGRPYEDFRNALLESGVPVNDLVGMFNKAGFKGAQDFFEAAPTKNVKGGYQPLVDRIAFDHDNLSGPTVITARDSMLTPPTSKPVVKGTVEEVKSMVKGKELSAKKHEVFYPEGTQNPDAPAYIIRKEGTKKTPTSQIKAELVNPETESRWLGYPDRSNVDPSSRATAAVTKQGEVVTEPARIIEESANKNLQWSAEGAPEEVVAKANEIAKVEEPIVTPSQEIKSSPTGNMEAVEVSSAMGDKPAAPIPEDIKDLHAGLHPKEIVKGVDKTVDTIKKLWEGKTTFSMKNFARGFSEVQFLAEKVPSVADLYEFNKTRRHNRKAIETDLYRDNPTTGYKGVESLGYLKKQMSKNELRDLDSLIESSDAFQVFMDRDTLRTDNHFIGRPVSEKVIDAYHLYKEIQNATTVAEFNWRRSLAIEPYREHPWFPEIERIAKGEIELEDLPNYLDDTGLAYNAEFMSVLNKIQERLGEINETERQYLEKPYHASRVRDQGDWEVRVYPVIDGVVSPQEIFMKMAKTEDQAKALEKDLLANPEKHFKYNLANAKRSNVLDGWGKPKEVTFIAKSKETTATPESIYLYSGTESAKSALLRDMLANAKEAGKISTDHYDKLVDSLFTSLDEQIWSRGYNRTKIQRESHLIEGYKNTDYIQQLQDRISNMAGSVTKAKYAMDSLRLMKDASTLDKVLLDDLIRNSLENRNSQLNKWGATARTAQAIIHLAGKPSAVLVNGFTNVVSGAGEMNMRLRNMGLSAKADIAVPKAQADLSISSAKYGLEYIKSRVTGAEKPKKHTSNLLSGEEQRFLADTERLGVDEPQLIREQFGLSEEGVNKNLQKVADYTMSMFQWGEKTFNRQSLALAMFRELRKNKVPYEKASQEAWNLSDTVHGDMSPENMPPALQGGKYKGEAARTALTLRRWQIHYLNWMFNRIAQKQYRPVARAAFMTGILGGVMGLPTAYVINDVAERKFGKSPKLAVKKYFHSMLGKDEFADVASNAILYGMPSETIGVNFSRQMSIDVPFLFEEGEKTFGEKLAGVYASDTKALGNSIDYFKRGLPYKGVETFPLTPDAISLPMAAYRQRTEGVTNNKGVQAKDKEGKPVTFTNSEAIKRAAGFSPARIAGMQSMNQSEFNLEAYYSQRKKLVNGMPRKTPDDRKAYYEAKKELNAEISKLSGLVPKLTSQTRTDYRSKRRRRFENNYLGGDE